MGNWLNIVIILVAVGGPVFGAVWKRLEAAGERRKIEQEIQRRRDEALRTGQVVQGAPSLVAPTQATDSAALHRARLEELRRRQQERLRKAAAGGQVRAAPLTILPGQIPTGAARPPAQRPGARPVPPRPVPSGVAVRASVPPQPSQRVPQQQGTSRRMPTSPRAPAARPPARVASDRPADRDQVVAGLLSAIEKDDRSSRVASADSMGEIAQMAKSRATNKGNRAMAFAFGSSNPTRADLRRAIVLRELLDAPVALRGGQGLSIGGTF